MLCCISSSWHALILGLIPEADLRDRQEVTLHSSLSRVRLRAPLLSQRSHFTAY